MSQTSDLEKKILDFFNGVTTPDEIVNKIRDDPLYGSSSPRAYGVRKSLAERILKVRKEKYDDRFPNVAAIDDIDGVGEDTYHDIHHAFLKNTSNYPVALFPFRLETRFKEDQLWVRIYPDDVCIDSHDRRITKKESEALDKFNNILSDDSVDDEVKHAAWRNLVKKYGLPRATYLATLHEKEFIKDEIFSPRVRILPSYFHVWVYKDGKAIYDKAGNAIPEQLPLMRTTDHPAEGDAYFDEDSLWVADFASAEAVGMAVKIPLNNGEEGPFDKVVAIGIKEDLSVEVATQRIEELLESHKFSKGIGFLPYGTPTNNTNTSESGYSEQLNEETEDSFDSIKSDDGHQIIPDSNADIFSHLMGIRTDVLRGIDYAQEQQEFCSSHLRDAVWPALGDYYVSSMVSSSITHDNRWQLWDHFKNYVYGRGYCPSLRIGKQPYGIMLARSQSGWGVSNLDGFDNDTTASDPVNFDFMLHRLIQRIYNAYWIKMAKSGAVPNIGNPADLDQELTSILAMSPHSLSFHGRSFIDDRFVAFLLNTLGNYFFGENSGFAEASPETVEYWKNRWATLWRDIENPPDQVLKEIAIAVGLDDAALLGPALSNLFSWGTGRSIENSLVSDSSSGSGLDYLNSFTQLPETLPQVDENKPILYELLRRSLAYQHSYAEEERLVPPEIEAQSISFKDYYAQGNITEIYFAVGEVFNKGDIVAQIHLGVFPDVPGVPPVHWYHDVEAPAGGIVTEIVSSEGTSIQPREEVVILNYEPTQPTELRICDSVKALKDSGIDEETLKGHFVDVLDLLTHRLDAWVTSFATKRIHGMRKTAPEGIHIGAYAYVENLSKNDQATGDIAQGNPGGYIHAPSVGQAATAALLRNAYLTHQTDIDGNAYRINLSSERVRRAMRILQGLREGQELPELLGFQLERQLHDANLDLLIDEFRSIYPLVAGAEVPASADPQYEESVEAIAARNVADGLAIARDISETEQWTSVETKLEDILGQPLQSLLQEQFDNQAEEKYNELIDILDGLRDSLDAINDALIHESVFHAVQGNYERSGAALEAMNGLNKPPELESIKTPSSAVSLGYRVCLLFEPAPELDQYDERYPRRMAEPRIDQWLAELLGEFDQIGCLVTVEGENDDVAVKFSDLDLCALDLLSISADETQKSETDLDRYIKYYIRTRSDLVSDNVLMINYDTKSVDYTRSFGEAFELLKTVRNVISINKKYITPCALSRPEGQPGEEEEDEYVEDAFILDDYNELRVRVNTINTDFTEALDEVLPTTSFEPEKYLNLSRFNLVEAIPPEPPAASPPIPPETESEFDIFKRSVIKKATKIQTTAALKLNEADAFLELDQPDYNKGINKLREVAQILLGENFVILPTCTPSNRTELSPAFSYSDTLINQNPENVNLWLQQVAEVNPHIQQLEDMLLTRAAWQSAWVTDETGDDYDLIEIDDQSNYEFHVAQLPVDACDIWMALPDVKEVFSGLEERPRSVTSFVCLAGDNMYTSLQDDDYQDAGICGLVIDAWDEKIPQFGQEDTHGNREIPTQQTGLSFQYDRPNAQAPQCLLLAVPNTLNEEADDWEVESLRDIVCETMELAKTRAVDLDAFAEVGGIVPGLYLPVDANTPGWARDILMETLEDIIQVEEPVPVYEVDRYLDMYGDVWQDGPSFRTSNDMTISMLGGGSFSFGMFDYPGSGGDADTVIMSTTGMRFELDNTVGKIGLVLGWVNENDSGITVYDDSSNIINAQVQIQEWNSTEPQGASPQHVNINGNYHVFDCEITIEGIRSFEITGNCLLNRIITYRQI